VRLFVALEIPPACEKTLPVFRRFARFPRNRGGCGAENLHFTLKFIGEKAQADTSATFAGALPVRSDQRLPRFRGLGFFPVKGAARFLGRYQASRI